MSSEEMVQAWLSNNEPKRSDGYSGTPKLEKRIFFSRGGHREKRMSQRRAEQFGKYIEKVYT